MNIDDKELELFNFHSNSGIGMELKDFESKGIGAELEL